MALVVLLLGLHLTEGCAGFLAYAIGEDGTMAVATKVLVVTSSRKGEQFLVPSAVPRGKGRYEWLGGCLSRRDAIKSVTKFDNIPSLALVMAEQVFRQTGT